MTGKITKLFFAAIFLLTISSCDKRSCTKVVCASYQTCYEGQCLCPDGYEGTDCTTSSLTKYISNGGNWYVTENCGGSAPPNFSNYSVYMEADPIHGANYLAITPLLTYGTVYAEILNTSPSSEGNTIFIPAQSLGGVQIANSQGTYFPPSTSGGSASIILTLNYTSNGISYSCQETFYKQ